MKETKLEDNLCIKNVTDVSGHEQDQYFSTEIYILSLEGQADKQIKQQIDNVGYREVPRRKIKQAKRIECQGRLLGEDTILDDS